MSLVAVSTKYGKMPLNYEQLCALLSCVYSGKRTGQFHVVEWPASEMEYVRSFAVLGCLGIMAMSNFVILIDKWLQKVLSVRTPLPIPADLMPKQ